MNPRLPGAAYIPPLGIGRLETRPIQIGDDWTGLFIRGDHAFSYAVALLPVLNFARRQSANINTDVALACNVVAGLLDTLISCNENLTMQETMRNYIATMQPPDIARLQQLERSLQVPGPPPPPPPPPVQQPMSGVKPQRGSTSVVYEAGDERSTPRMTDRWKVLLTPGMTGWYPAAVPWGDELTYSQKQIGCKLIEPPPEVSAGDPAKVIQWGYDHKDLWFKT